MGRTLDMTGLSHVTMLINEKLVILQINTFTAHTEQKTSHHALLQLQKKHAHQCMFKHLPLCKHAHDERYDQVRTTAAMLL